MLRSIPTDELRTRIEVLFQNVERLDLPMNFEGLSIKDATSANSSLELGSDMRIFYPERRLYRLTSGQFAAGCVLASACVFGEDDGSATSPSMFPMMDRTGEWQS
jgi:hypothetical protein